MQQKLREHRALGKERHIDARRYRIDTRRHPIDTRQHHIDTNTNKDLKLKWLALHVI